MRETSAIAGSNRIDQDEMNKAGLGYEVALVGRKIRSLLKLFLLPLLLAFCTLFYYLGELVSWAAWDSVRQEFFYGMHDVHRLLFLVPIAYAGYTARIKGAVIVTLVSFIIFLPRALFISPFPDPLLRMALFTIYAGTLGCLTAIAHNESERYQRLELMMRSERDKLLSILDGMADGVIITGPDYRIRFMNSKMVKDFGPGTGSACYKHFHHLDSPCKQNCKISDVIDSREIRNWKCDFPDGGVYEIVAAPYIDTDGVVCQISLFRNVTGR